MAQLNDSSHLVTENGDGSQITGALVPRDHELNGYTAIGAPMVAPMWQEQSAGGMSVTKMLHSFRRRWMLALFMGLLLGLPAALATWLIFPKQFEVEAMLQFRNRQASLGDTGPVDLEADRQWRETQLHLIRSQLLLTDTLREPKVANLSLIRNEDEPIYFLQKSISVYSPKDSNLIIIRMKGEDAREMVEIVRTLTEKYVTRAQDTAGSDRNRMIERLESEVTKNDDKFATKNNAFVQLSKDMGAADSEEAKTKKQQYASEIAALQDELRTVKHRLWQAKLDVENIKARHDSIDEGRFPEALLMDEIKDDPRMIALQEKIADMEEVYDYQRQVAKDPLRNPAVLSSQKRLKGLHEAVEQLKSELRETALLKRRYGKDGGEDSLPVAEQRVKNLLDEESGIMQLMDERKKDLLSLSQDSAMLNSLEAELKRIEDNGNKLYGQLNKAYLDVSLPPPVEVIEPADEPEGSTLMYRVILTTFLGLLCFSVGIAGVVLLEYTKQRVSTLNDIGYGGLGLRVLGTVPNLARLAHSKNGEANGAVSGILAESIDSVRTMLLSNKRADAPKVILVTSADEHEGKTTVATHLAASLARAGRRTLLIDGDLRKPAVHMLFDMPLSAGLCEVLRGEAEIDAVLHPAQVEGMWVMLAGQCDQRAIASLAKENAEAVFRTLRADYEFVVVDTGPALAFADTMLMGSHADAAVMAILRDVSQIPKVYEARERLEAIGLPVLGGVVGGVSTSGSRNYALMN